MRLKTAVVVVLLAGVARGDARRAVRWNVAGTSSEDPLQAGSNLLVVNGDWIRCHDLGSGRQLWAKRFEGLIPRSLVWTGRTAFLLAKGGLYKLDMANGALTRQRALVRPRSLVASTTQRVVSDATGTYWLDPQGNVTAHSAKKGTLQGLDGQRIVLFVQRHARKGSPKQLLVIDPSQPRPLLTFKLLATGQHELLQLDSSGLIFVDHCGGGKKRHRLYLTTIALPSGKKRDLSLGKLFNPQHIQLGFAKKDDTVVIASYGGTTNQEKTLLVAVDPQKRKVRWKRRGLLLSTGPRFSRYGILVGVSAEGGAGAVKVHDPQTGAERSTQQVDAAPMWPPQLAGPCLIVQTQRSLYCLDAAPKPVSAVQPVATGGWQHYQDRLIGYKLSIPPSWKLAHKHVRKLGTRRYSLPFVRYLRRGSRWVLQGTVHLLVREAAGQDTEGFWRSVAAFRRRQDPALRILKREQRMLGGFRATVAQYTMHNRAGAVEQWRSLCLVYQGVAYELRAWSSPLWERQIWPEVEKIMDTFRPYL